MAKTIKCPVCLGTGGVPEPEPRYEGGNIRFELCPLCEGEYVTTIKDAKKFEKDHPEYFLYWETE